MNTVNNATGPSLLSAEQTVQIVTPYELVEMGLKQEIGDVYISIWINTLILPNAAKSEKPSSEVSIKLSFIDLKTAGNFWELKEENFELEKFLGVSWPEGRGMAI